MMKLINRMAVAFLLVMGLTLIPRATLSAHATDDGVDWGEILPGDRPASVASIPEGLWIAGEREYYYSGKAVKPDVRVYYEKTRLVWRRDYTLSYKNNIKAAAQSAKKAPTVTVKGLGDYAGSASEKFTITSFDMKDAVLASSVFPSKTNYQPVILTPEGDVLKAGTDYTISYQTTDGAQPKTASEKGYTLTVTGKGSCQNSKTFEFHVKDNALSLGKATVTIEKTVKYGGSLPTPQVSLNGTTLVSGTDYMVKYYNATQKGAASAVIIGIGNCSGIKTVKFNIAANTFKKVLGWNVVRDKQKDDKEKEPPKEVLVAYFSATGNTKGIAQKIAQASGAELFEIVPAVPYTSADLNYNNSDSRANKEQNDPNARPEISSKVMNLEDYGTVIIGLSHLVGNRAAYH